MASPLLHMYLSARTPRYTPPLTLEITLFLQVLNMIYFHVSCAIVWNINLLLNTCFLKRKIANGSETCQS